MCDLSDCVLGLRVLCGRLRAERDLAEMLDAAEFEDRTEGVLAALSTLAIEPGRLRRPLPGKASAD